MAILGLFTRGGLRGTVYTLFGVLVLSTLWVTSLSVLSAQPNATDLLSQAGTQVLQPFLAKQDILVQQGLVVTPGVYDQLRKSSGKQPVPLFTVQVQGSSLPANYSDGMTVIYREVATTYYTGGPGATFAVPAQFSQISDLLHNFALFDPNNIPILPNGPTPAQLPVFLQPLFTVVLLSPDTFTAAGHQKLLDLLPYFWLATVVLGVLAVVLNRSEQKLAALLHGILHGSWPVVAILLGLWIASLTVLADRLGPYTGILGTIMHAFLPVYGTAVVVSVLGLLATRFLPGILARQGTGAASGEQGVPATVGATMRARTSTPESAGSGGGMGGSSSGMMGSAASASAPESSTQPSFGQLGQLGQMGGQASAEAPTEETPGQQDAGTSR